MSASSFLSVLTRIKIETYWNVNKYAHAPFFLCNVIKIETYWNVNRKQSSLSDFDAIIKIETYWNVN